MKKIVVSLLIMMYLLTIGTVAYAETGSETGTADGKSVWQEKREVLKEKVQSARDIHAQVQPQVAEIKTNRSALSSLKAEARNAHKDAAAHIKELKENQDNLSEEQLAQLKQAVETLKQSRTALADSAGDIHAETLNLRSARQEKNVEKIQESLNNIIAIQKSRIDILNKSIEDLKSILNI